MTSLVTCLGAGKGTWVPVLQLIDGNSWDAVFLIMPAFFADKYQPQHTNITKIIIDDTQSVETIQQQLIKEFDGKLFGETAVDLTSGGGLEHMAILSALLKTGCGIRLVHTVNNELGEL